MNSCEFETPLEDAENPSKWNRDTNRMVLLSLCRSIFCNDHIGSDSSKCYTNHYAEKILLQGPSLVVFSGLVKYSASQTLGEILSVWNIPESMADVNLLTACGWLDLPIFIFCFSICSLQKCLLLAASYKM